VLVLVVAAEYVRSDWVLRKLLAIHRVMQAVTEQEEVVISRWMATAKGHWQPDTQPW